MRITTSCLMLVFLLAGCGGTAPEEPAASPQPEPAAESPLLIGIRNAKLPLDGVLVGGQPTRQQLIDAWNAGYKTIVNLREYEENGAWDETEYVTELGMSYVHIPMAGEAGLTRENAVKLAEVLDDPARRPVMVHCASGNRVGALIALKVGLLDGASADEAMQLAVDAGVTRLEDATRAFLEQAELR